MQRHVVVLGRADTTRYLPVVTARNASSTEEAGGNRHHLSTRKLAQIGATKRGRTGDR